MSLASGRSQLRLLRSASQCAYVRDAPTYIPESLSEIVEIKTLRLAIFVVRYHQVGDGLRLRTRSATVAELLALRFALKFLRPLLLASVLSDAW